MHADFQELLALRDGTPVGAEVGQHVAGCAQCGSELARLKRLKHELHQLPSFEPQEHAWPLIRERLATLFASWTKDIEEAVRDAQADGSVSTKSNPADLAAYPSDLAADARVATSPEMGFNRSNVADFAAGVSRPPMSNLTSSIRRLRIFRH